jgi:hypothetical protein
MNGKTDGLYAGALDTGARIDLDLGACGVQQVGYFHQHSDHVDWVFVDHPSYHRPGKIPSGAGCLSYQAEVRSTTGHRWCQMTADESQSTGMTR